MLNSLKQKIESKRNSKNIGWIFLINIKDIIWKLYNEREKLLDNYITNKICSKLYASKILSNLTPYLVKEFEEMIRLGNKQDGGYVLPKQVLSAIEAEYCYGVGEDISFERDLIKYKELPCRFYDHTVKKIPIKNKNFLFKKEGIYSCKKKNLDTLKNHLIQNNDLDKKILLKIDIEGEEWHIMKKIAKNDSNNILALILEIHNLNKEYKYRKYVRVLNEINKRFTLVHVHGNNCGGKFKFNKINFPKVMELTFLNNKLVTKKERLAHNLPSKLDFPNNKYKKDILLNYWKKRE